MADRKRDGFFRRLMRHLGNAVMDRAEAAAAQGAHRVREFVRDAKNGGRHVYDGKLFRSARHLNAYHLARDGGYWAGDRARKVARKMGKQADAARKFARGTREAHGLIDHMGHRTARGRSRPVPERGTVLTGRHLGELHRHHRDHDRAAKSDRKAHAREARAADREAQADRHEAAGRTRAAARHRAAAAAHREQADGHRASAQERRDRWPARTPQAAPPRAPEPHPVGARPAPVPNGTRTAPGRSPNGNGTRPAPERTGRTRT